MRELRTTRTQQRRDECERVNGWIANTPGCIDCTVCAWE